MLQHRRRHSTLLISHFFILPRRLLLLPNTETCHGPLSSCSKKMMIDRNNMGVRTYLHTRDHHAWLPQLSSKLRIDSTIPRCVRQGAVGTPRTYVRLCMHGAAVREADVGGVTRRNVCSRGPQAGAAGYIRAAVTDVGLMRRHRPSSGLAVGDENRTPSHHHHLLLLLALMRQRGPNCKLITG